MQTAQCMQGVIDRLAIACVGHRLAATRMTAAGNARHDDVRLCLGAAGDYEGLGERPRLGPGLNELGFAGRCHGVVQPRRPEAWARKR